MSNSLKTGNRWSKFEDNYLKSHSAYEDIATIAQHLKRSPAECDNRHKLVITKGLTKGPWTQKEDNVILDCVKQGIVNVSTLSSHNTSTVFLHFLSFPYPSLSTCRPTPFTIVSTSTFRFFLQWGTVSSLIPGRIAKQCRERW